MSMKLLTDTAWKSLTGIIENAGNSDASFPITNVLNIDPMTRWKGKNYATTASSIIKDFTTTQTANALFLNQVNFPLVNIYQGTYPAPLVLVAANIPCVKDAAGNRKLFYPFTFNAKCIAIEIPTGQTLDDGDTEPMIGNIIFGTSVDLPPVSEYSKQIIQKQFRFQTDSGSNIAKRDGRKKHAISATFGGATFTEVAGVITGWEYAVLFENMGRSQDAYLVLEPEAQDMSYKGYLHTDFRINFDEKI